MLDRLFGRFHFQRECNDHLYVVIPLTAQDLKKANSKVRDFIVPGHYRTGSGDIDFVAGPDREGCFTSLNVSDKVEEDVVKKRKAAIVIFKEEKIRSILYGENRFTPPDKDFILDLPKNARRGSHVFVVFVNLSEYKLTYANESFTLPDAFLEVSVKNIQITSSMIGDLYPKPSVAPSGERERLSKPYFRIISELLGNNLETESKVLVRRPEYFGEKEYKEKVKQGFINQMAWLTEGVNEEITPEKIVKKLEKVYKPPTSEYATVRWVHAEAHGLGKTVKIEKFSLMSVPQPALIPSLARLVARLDKYYDLWSTKTVAKHFLWSLAVLRLLVVWSGNLPLQQVADCLSKIF